VNPGAAPTPHSWQVLRRAIAPATPDAAAAPEASKARQHCRQLLARLVRCARAGSASVLLAPGDGGKPVRLPAALLALHSRLFLDMQQSGCLGGGGSDEDAADYGGGPSAAGAAAPPMRVSRVLVRNRG
jgi:hypothetical protein